MSDDLKQRLKGVLYLLPLLVGAMAGQPFLLAVICILQLLISYELAKIIIRSVPKIMVLTALFFATSASLFIGGEAGMQGMVTASLLGVSVATALIAQGRFSAVFTAVTLVCLACLTLLVQTDNALFLLAALLMIIAAGDVGAYFVGRFVGGRKLAPSISPGKTLSGAIGGLACSMIMAVFFADHIHVMSANPLITGLIIGVLAQAGDLYESAFKRRVGIKDSSNLIPGHGGFLDRFDGYLFVVPFIIWLQAVQGG